MSVTSLSYGFGGICFFICTIYLFRLAMRQRQYRLHTLAAFITGVWATGGALTGYVSPRAFHFLELSKDLSWILVLIMLLRPQDENALIASPFRHVLKLIGGVFLAIFLLDIYLQLDTSFALRLSLMDVWALEYIVLAVTGLILLEQLVKNADERQRWAVKFYFIGLGAIFCYDLVLYSDAILFKQRSQDLWDARGIVTGLIAPLLVLAVARGVKRPAAMAMSHKMAFHSASLMGAGVYLLVVSTVGYYLRNVGGAAGIVLQVVFLVIALVMLLILLFSDQLRAKVRVFIAKHFYRYRYDYRDEWLRFMQSFSDADYEHNIGVRAIEALAAIVNSSGGVLWIKDTAGQYVISAQVEMQGFTAENLEAQSSMIMFMKNHDWVIDIKEYKGQSSHYESMELPAWMLKAPQARLLVPLFHHDVLYAVLLLKQPRVDIDLNWEDRDLLKTAGRQAAGYLALMQTSQSLFEARQFEAFNRLSAYVVHDLKNVVAQLSLVVRNAEKHKSNPAFIDDAFATIDNAVNRMTKMLSQLRKDRGAMVANVEKVNVLKVLEELCQVRAQQSPEPQLASHCQASPYVFADSVRLHAVIEHIIQNAQEATPEDGQVTVDLACDNATVTIAVRDNGCGMDEAFIRERLFKPFDTTKGNAGMGIGVYEAREYVQGLGGKIVVNSTPGAGTSFIISLPICRE